MKGLGRKAVVCFLAVFALGVSAVIGKTRREEGHRHDMLSKSRLHSNHHTVKKVLHESRREDNAWGTSSVNSDSKWNVRHRRHRSGKNWFTGLGWNVDGENGWWKGPNVCIRHETHEETDENEEIYDNPEIDKGKAELDKGKAETKYGNHTIRKIQHSSTKMSRRCENTETAHKCTVARGVNGKLVTSVKIYECCPGYERKSDAPGCLKAFDVTDLKSTFERLKVTRMAIELKKSGLSDVDRQNYTIFAPTNNAFEQAKDKDASSIMGHVVKGEHRTIDVDDDQLLDTQLPSTAIRINKYIIDASSIVTANCVPLVVKDVPATNGIVHVVQNILPTVTKSLDQLVLQIPQLTQLSKVIQQLQLSDRGQYTLFAPTDTAFKNMKSSLRDKIFKGHKCGIEILRQHLLPSVFCSAVAKTQAVTRNVLHRLITLDREAANLTVNGASVVDSDIMGTNGVMHIVDQVLIPKDAGDIFDVMDRPETKQFLQLITDAGLTERLQNMNDFTIFVPTNDALKVFSDNNYNSLRKNSKQFEKMFSYHVVPERILYQNLENDMQLPTLDGNDKMLVKSYESFPFTSVKTVQCAPIEQSHVDSCEDIVHVVSKVLQPPSGDVMDVLKKDTNFSLLVTLVELFNLEKLFKTNDPLTFFAPTNKAFDSLSQAALKHLRQDPKTFTGIIKSHMLADVLCCGGIFENTFPFSSPEVNLDDWNVSLQKDDEILFSGVRVISCDQIATNGVVHSIDQFAPEALRRYGITHKTTLWKRLLQGSDFVDY